MGQDPHDDGFDELALRVGFDRAPDHFEAMASAVVGKAKVGVTSRTEDFLTTDQVLKPLGKSFEGAPYRLVGLLGFDDRQVAQFLTKKLGSTQKAVARQTRMKDVSDLSGLIGTPPRRRLKLAVSR